MTYFKNMKFDWEEHDKDVDTYWNTDRHCPKCSTECETDSSQSNERDSSSDRHYCPKCGWQCSEMAVWEAEERARNKK